MEPSGHNPWQPVASRMAPKMVQTNQSAIRGTHGNGSEHYKEGIDGSSPSEALERPRKAGPLLCWPERGAIERRRAWKALEPNADHGDLSRY